MASTARWFNTASTPMCTTQSPHCATLRSDACVSRSLTFVRCLMTFVTFFPFFPEENTNSRTLPAAT